MLSGLGGNRSGQVLFSDAQLAGGVPPVIASNSAAVSVLISALRIGKPVAVWMKAVTSSRMQAAYCATVAVQVDGRSLQPRLLAQGSVPWQAVSLLLQLLRSTSCEGAPRDAA